MAPGLGPDHTARLLMSCLDGPGIVAAVSSFLFERGANIIASDQYSTDAEHGTFFMRIAFWLPEIESDPAPFEAAFGELVERFNADWRIAYAHHRRRVALMASREDHCLLDLLWRHRRGELDMDRADFVGAGGQDIADGPGDRPGARVVRAGGRARRSARRRLPPAPPALRPEDVRHGRCGLRGSPSHRSWCR